MSKTSSVLFMLSGSTWAEPDDGIIASHRVLKRALETPALDRVFVMEESTCGMK